MSKPRAVAVRRENNQLCMLATPVRLSLSFTHSEGNLSEQLFVENPALPGLNFNLLLKSIIGSYQSLPEFINAFSQKL